MNADTNRKLDMLKRINRFIVEHPITPAIPRLAAAHTEVTTVINALEAAAQTQTSGSGESEGGVDVRLTISAELREYLKNVNRTARILEKDHPGISPTFRLPKSGSYPALMATARAIISTAAPLHASFVDAGLPPTFLAEIQTMLTAFDCATTKKHDGGIARVRGTATLKAMAILGMEAATELDACVRNHFRGNAEMLAAWVHARRVERAPRRSGEAVSSERAEAISTAAEEGQSDDRPQRLESESAIEPQRALPNWTGSREYGDRAERLNPRPSIHLSNEANIRDHEN